MKCKLCQKEYQPKHFNQKLCSDECKIESLREVNKRYKVSEKGRESAERWSKSEAKKEIDKRYRKTENAMEKARIRATRYRKLHPLSKEKLEQKHRLDKEYSQTETGKEKRNKATRKYRKTEKGNWIQKVYKYRSRNNESGKIDLKEWKEKLQKLNGICQMCKTDKNITIDHIKPLSKGGTNCIDNLQPLCKSCNSRKNNKYE
jgi:5-methylcytosine-specific restriction endonuclease McrA